MKESLSDGSFHTGDLHHRKPGDWNGMKAFDAKKKIPT